MIIMIKGEKKGKEDRYWQHHHSFLHFVSANKENTYKYMIIKKGGKKGKEDRYRQHHHSFLHSVSGSFAFFCFFFSARTLKQDSTLRQNRSSDDHWRDYYRRHRLARRPGRDCRRWHGCLYCFLCTDTVLFVKILFSMCHTHAKNAVLYV